MILFLNNFTGVAITNGGSGYVSPIVTFSAPGSGVTVTGTVTETGGVITGITISNPGSGYTAAPTVTISGSPGTGATAVAFIDSMGTVSGELPPGCVIQPDGTTDEDSGAVGVTVCSRANAIDVIFNNITPIPSGSYGYGFYPSPAVVNAGIKASDSPIAGASTMGTVAYDLYLRSSGTGFRAMAADYNGFIQVQPTGGPGGGGGSSRILVTNVCVPKSGIIPTSLAFAGIPPLGSTAQGQIFDVVSAYTSGEILSVAADVIRGVPGTTWTDPLYQWTGSLPHTCGSTFGSGGDQIISGEWQLYTNPTTGAITSITVETEKFNVGDGSNMTCVTNPNDCCPAKCEIDECTYPAILHATISDSGSHFSFVPSSFGWPGLDPLSAWCDGSTASRPILSWFFGTYGLSIQTPTATSNILFSSSRIYIIGQDGCLYSLLIELVLCVETYSWSLEIVIQTTIGDNIYEWGGNTTGIVSGNTYTCSPLALYGSNFSGGPFGGSAGTPTSDSLTKINITT